MDDISGGWSKNQRDWFSRMEKKAHRNKGRCLKKAGFYRKIVSLYLKIAQKIGKENLPDGLWRYALMMEIEWLACYDIWDNIAEKINATIANIDYADVPALIRDQE